LLVQAKPKLDSDPAEEEVAAGSLRATGRAVGFQQPTDRAAEGTAAARTVAAQVAAMRRATAVARPVEATLARYVDSHLVSVMRCIALDQSSHIMVHPVEVDRREDTAIDPATEVPAVVMPQAVPRVVAILQSAAVRLVADMHTPEEARPVTTMVRPIQVDLLV
jgi:hypothetical protein